ncbi:MAG: serine/threonine protein kinase, partial [Myxococcales bacterium]|nr:serine/threonine protein kinase [Myxococcales bacterium]
MVRGAYDPELDRRVAIKLLRSDGQGKGSTSTGEPEDLLEEARMAAKLSHPNVVAIYDVGRLDESVHYSHRRGAPRPRAAYIVMEHLGGPSLGQWIAGRQTGSEPTDFTPDPTPDSAAQRRSWSEILTVYIDAGRGLAAAHAQGLVHRDFKPQNLRFGDDGRVRVLDFGLARLANTLAHKKGISGTPLFMAPEIMTGRQADARSDLYAFCVSLWSSLYGSWPFPGKTLDEILPRKLDRISPPTDTAVPTWVGALLSRGLDPDPAARFADMGELLAALADDPRHKRRRLGVLVCLALTMVAAGVGLNRLVDRGDPCAPDPQQFAGVWDEDVRALIRQRFDRPELPYAAASLASVEAGLDRYTKEWSSARVGVCHESLEQGAQTVDEAGLTLECLDRQLRRLNAVSSGFQSADEPSILNAADILGELQPPRSCREEAKARMAARSRVATGSGGLELERRLIDAETLHRTGQYEQAL